MQTIAYLGPEKTNTHFAARKKFGPKAKYLHVPTVEDVFEKILGEEVSFGVVPVENSLEGTVAHTLDQFSEFPEVRIYGEIEIPIEHCLVTRRGTRIDNVRAIFSHPQALAQCREWLRKNIPKANLFEASSTAQALSELVPSLRPRAFRKFRVLDPKVCAAIGRREIAHEYRLEATRIPIRRENRTRFLIVSRKSPRRGKRGKTSIMFALKDRPGALHDVLVPFKKTGINLTKIESRPSKRRAWEYVFFVDCEGYESDPKVRKAIEALRRRTSECRVLGSYPLEVQR